jgi:citrate lyase beta subunit
LRHHRNNPDFKFIVEPVTFNKNSERNLLQYCLGATLYMPGTKEITSKVLGKELNYLTSMVMCFEDAIQESDVGSAEQNVLTHLETLAGAIRNGQLSYDDLPLTFLRVRNPEQFMSFAKRLNADHASVLSGFVFPKFFSSNAQTYLGLLESLNRDFKTRLYGMPIFEGRAIALKETRMEELVKIKEIMRPFKDLILNVRVGGTDFSAIFGVRRGINYTIYDILPVKDCLCDVLNFFNRDEEDYLISAPVWEYFLADKGHDVDQELANNIHRSLRIGNPIFNEAIDGLLREVILDKANGFVGKTIIHPSHARYVNALQSVTEEEYDDSCQILQASGGVVRGKNKMNEINPHMNWARKIALRAQAYGVVADEASFVRLFSGNG